MMRASHDSDAAHKLSQQLKAQPCPDCGGACDAILKALQKSLVDKAAKDLRRAWAKVRRQGAING
jgi:hypothetical protein